MFPTLAVLRAVSRLGRGQAQRGRHAVGEGGEVSVFLDGSEVGHISPKQIEVYQVAPGEHSLGLRFLGGLRRSRKLNVSLGNCEEGQFVCVLNAIGWPSIRSATPQDVAAMERFPSPVVAVTELA